MGDGIFAIGRGFKRLKNDQNNIASNPSEQTLTSGWVGWHNVYLNAVAQNKLLISPGINFGDMILGSKQVNNNNSQSIKDPAGYYFHAGLGLMATYLITDQLWVEGHFNYDKAVVKAKNPPNNYTKNEGYALPSFFAVGGAIHSVKFPVFGGVRLVKMMDGGANKDSGSRLDISIGAEF